MSNQITPLLKCTLNLYPLVVLPMACWKGKESISHHLKVWQMIPLYLVWCLGEDQNAQHLDDQERTVLELWLFAQMPLFLHDRSQCPTLVDFMQVCFLNSLKMDINISCILYVLGLHHFALLTKSQFLIMKVMFIHTFRYQPYRYW